MKSSAALVLLMAALSAIPSAAMPLGLRLSAQAAAKGAAEKDPMELTEAEAYERYAPDTAFVIDVTDLSSESAAKCRVYLGDFRSDSEIADRWIDWGDGSRTNSITKSGFQYHTYTRTGKYVVRISDCTINRTGPGFVSYFSNYMGKVIFALRYGDHISAFGGVNGGFQQCRGLRNDKWLPRWPTSLTSANSTFSGCTSLAATSLPAWPTSLTSADSTYKGCTGLTGAWTSDPAELMPTNITSHDNCVSGASDALRALFYSDWGGTRTKTE